MKIHQKLAALSLSTTTAIMITIIISTTTLIVSLVFSTNLSRANALTPSCNATNNLTGIWTANDNGTYYIRQDGYTIWWFGVSDPKASPGQAVFANVYNGQYDGTSIMGIWADVPWGHNTYKGLLHLKVSPDCHHLERVSATAGFMGSRWTKT